MAEGPATLSGWRGLPLLAPCCVSPRWMGSRVGKRTLVAALNPCGQLRCLQADAGAVAMAGKDRRGLGQGQQSG